MKQEFKVGDKVYCLRLGNKIFTVHQEKDYHGMDNFLVGIVGGRIVNFDNSGISHHLLFKGQQVVTHATTENYEMLSKLYPNTEFEAPREPKAPKEVIQAMLNSGWIGVTCYVSDDNKRPSKHDKKSLITSINETRKFPFCGGGCWWLYATPFDLSTGKIIIDYIDGEIVTE